MVRGRIHPRSNRKMEKRIMSKDHESKDHADRGSVRTFRTAAAQKMLAENFVQRWLQPAKRSVDLAWVKVLAERVMGAEFGESYVWIAQADVEAALRAASYRLRRCDRHVYAYCAPKSRALRDWRFFRRG